MNAVTVSIRALSVAALLAAGLWLGAAGAQEPVRITIDQVIVEDGVVTALVSVTDAGGRPVSGVTAFETELDGESVDPDSVATAVDEEAGIAVLLLIDISGSMVGEPILQAREAASLFVSQLGPHDSAAIAPFGGDPPANVRFLSDQAALLAAVDELETEGNRGTALYDAVAAAIDESRQAPTARRALIVLTDGQDFGTSSRSHNDALSSATDAGIPIYAVGLGDAEVDFLSALAEAGSGDFYYAPEPEDMTGVFNAIGETLRGQYAIALPLDGDDEQRVLRVQLETPEGVIAATAGFEVPVAASGGGGGGPSTLLVVVAAIALLIVAGLGYAAVRRRRRPRYDTGGTGGTGRIGLPVSGNGKPAETAVSTGILRVLDGPNAGRQATISEAAIEIGAAESCGLTLEEAGGSVAPVHARAWLKGGRLMVHHVARRYETYVADESVEWAALEETDTLRIGPHVIGFSVERADRPVTDSLPQTSS